MTPNTPRAAVPAQPDALRHALESLINEAQKVADDYHKPRYARLDEAIASARAVLHAQVAALTQGAAERAVPEPPRAYAGKERGAWEHGFNSGRASHAQAPAGAAGAFIDGVNIERLCEALTFLGCRTDGQESMAANLSEHINAVTRAVLSCKELLRPTAQAAPAAGAVAGPTESLAEWALRATPEEFNAANWGAVHQGLLRAREELKKTGVVHSWVGPYIDIARQESQRKPSAAPTPTAQAESGVQEDAALSDEVMCGLETAANALEWIAKRQRIDGDVIEPVNDIRHASRLAAEGFRRIGIAMSIIDRAALAAKGQKP